jgi:hypothetical protein
MIKGVNARSEGDGRWQLHRVFAKHFPIHHPGKQVSCAGGGGGRSLKFKGTG